MLPLEFDDADPPAFQFQATYVELLLLTDPPVPKENPSLLNDVKPLESVPSAFVPLLFNSFVAPLTLSCKICE